MASSEPLEVDDLLGLRVEQARLLKERVAGSCLIVLFVISYIAAILLISSPPVTALLWFVSAVAMVGVTYIYAKLMCSEGINAENVSRYLRGHVIVSAATGAVWSALAIYQIDFASEYTIFIACLIVSSITMGGVLPSSIYRPGYIGLSIFAVPPVGLYLAFFAPGALKLVGMGMIVYFLFAMFISARVEIETRETIASRNAKILNEKIIAQNEMIQKSHDEKTRFLAATSHDLSQPLHSQGFFMHALRNLLNSQEQRQMLDRIEDSWRAQKHLLEGIVDISRIDSGAITARRSMVDLATEAEKLANEFRSDNIKPLTLNTHFDDIHVQTDPILLSRILRNLLSNARKFSPENSAIVFEVRQDGECVKFTISDNGPGIDALDHERIFEEYVQLDNAQSKAQDGLGLGLSIVRRLCDLLGIKITLRSALGGGTRFDLSMDIDAVERDDEPRSSRAMSKFRGNPLVILVDDEAAIRESMTLVLTGWNCQVMSGANSSEILTLVSKTSATPALLLVDKRLASDEDGLDLIHSLREEINEVVPAILMSGNLGSLDEKALGENITFMNKPLDPEEIWSRMEEAL
ncbi:MAG: ATP-binding protein [Sphingorhabdus sp.]